MIVFGLFSAIRKYEVGIASNRVSERYGEYFFGSRTHRPSRGESWGRLMCAGSLLVKAFLWRTGKAGVMFCFCLCVEVQEEY